MGSTLITRCPSSTASDQSSSSYSVRLNCLMMLNGMVVRRDWLLGVCLLSLVISPNVVLSVGICVDYDYIRFTNDYTNMFISTVVYW